MRDIRSDMVCENRNKKSTKRRRKGSTQGSWLYRVIFFPTLNTFLPVLVEDFAQVWGKKSLKWLQRAWSASAALPRENKKFR